MKVLQTLKKIKDYIIGLYKSEYNEEEENEKYAIFWDKCQELAKKILPKLTKKDISTLKKCSELNTNLYTIDETNKLYDQINKVIDKIIIMSYKMDADLSEDIVACQGFIWFVYDIMFDQIKD